MHRLLAMTPRRIAFAGDWHGNANWANGVITSLAARGVDVVVHVGDFGIWPGGQGREYLASVDKVAARSGIDVLFIDGNHDDHHQIAEAPRAEGLGRFGEHIWHIPRGTRWVWGEVRFGGLGGAVSVDRDGRTPGVSWWPEESITVADEQAFQSGGQVDVAVTHDCPSGVAIRGVTFEQGVRAWGYRAIVASEEHRKVLAAALDPTRPAVIVHGHYHVRSSGVWSHDGGWAEVEGLHCDGFRPAINNVLVTTIDDMALRVARVRAEIADSKDNP